KYSSSADHYNILTKTQKDGVTLEFQVSLNLFNGFSDKYQLESSKANKLAFQSQKAALIEKLKLELFKVLQSYELALNAYELSLTALKQAEENYRISNNRYQERIESTSNLLDAQLLLTQAKSNVVLNRYSILQSLAEIERITQTQNLSEATTN
ncbi:MAG: TolC family protein, partial [Helicobacter sp.]|nr:TolC family protein [Helicobacter sp.]